MKVAGRAHGWLLLLCLVAAAFPLSAGGKRDADLARADKLIAQRQYDEAIRILARHTGEKPDEFHRAQKRLRKIMRLRDGYNTLTGELLDVLLTDPDNSEKILDLTRRLETLEPARGTVRQFIAQVEELALFGYNRRLLEQIMVEARELLDRGEYAAAMRRYAGGLDIYQDKFFSMEYEESVYAQVRLSLGSLMSVIEEFAGLVAPFNNAVAGIGQVAAAGGADNLAQLRDYYARISPLLERLIAVNNAVAETGNYFDEQLARFRQEDPNLGDRNYLAFASRVLRGRSDSDVQEGFLGSIAGLWASGLSRFDAGLKNAADMAYRNAHAAQESRPQAREQFELVSAYGALAMEYLDDWNRFYQGQDFQTYEYFGDTVVAFKAQDYLQYYALDRAAESRIEAGPLLAQYHRLASSDYTALDAWRQGEMDAKTALAGEARVRGVCHDLAVMVEEALRRLNADDWALSDLRRELTGERERFAPMTDALALYEGLDANLFLMENAAAIREYAIANGDLQDRAIEWKGWFAEANRFLAGEPNADAAYVVRYPREALDLFARIDQGSARGLEDGGALIARYEAEPPRFFREPRIAALYNGLRSLLRELEDLRESSLDLEQTARIQVAQAEAFELEGDRFFREAQTALARGNFDTARDRALLSGERYDASLAIQESAALRRTRDTNLIALGAEITRLENEAVVREVRSLVNSARETYFEGDFETAEEYLVRAMNRWRS
ncbi:MAG: hypothetical protein LBU16_03330, partial [Treponema sp.]|nr:hypothetical protein [Treponema sp.]